MEGDRQSTLNYFEREGGILLSIKCLDEGVDIPKLDRAFNYCQPLVTRESTYSAEVERFELPKANTKQVFMTLSLHA